MGIYSDLKVSKPQAVRVTAQDASRRNGMFWAISSSQVSKPQAVRVTAQVIILLFGDGEIERQSFKTASGKSYCAGTTNINISDEAIEVSKPQAVRVTAQVEKEILWFPNNAHLVSKPQAVRVTAQEQTF